MATSATSLRLRRLRQRFGINAPKLAIRTHVAWYWRTSAAVAVLSISLALGAWIYDAVFRFSKGGEQSTQQVERLREQLAELQLELSKLSVAAAAGESALRIERTAQQQLAQRAKLLEMENAGLRQDVAFFESMLSPAGGREQPGVSIRRMQVEPSASVGAYRYRLLVVNNSAAQAKPFSGHLQFFVKLREGGKDAMIEHPRLGGPAAHGIPLEVRNFQRIEGDFVISAGAVIRDVEARITQDGVVRARQSVNP